MKYSIVYIAIYSWVRKTKTNDDTEDYHSRIKKSAGMYHLEFMTE